MAGVIVLATTFFEGQALYYDPCVTSDEFDAFLGQAAGGFVGGAAVGGYYSGPRGPLFGRARYRSGRGSGALNSGNQRLGWFWWEDSGRNWWGPHGGVPGTNGHWHVPLVPGPRGPAW